MGRTRAVVCLGVVVSVLWDLIAISKVFTSPFRVVSLGSDTAYSVLYCETKH